MKKIGIVGTGIMGAGMAANFLKKGYPVTVWNRSTDRLQPFVAQGAIAADTPRAVAEAADILFEVTADDASSRSVWLGDDGILAGANKETVLISSGTFSVAWVDELAEKCADQGRIYFDMPLTGGRIGAETGKLVLLVGGDEKKLEELKPDLMAISTEILYFGKAGSGARYKLILNTLQAVHMIGLAEALAVAEAAGMDIKKVGDALAARPGGTTTKLAWRDYETHPDQVNFSVKWITKDIEYTKQFAGGLKTPLLDDVLSRFQKTREAGKGDEDWTEAMRMEP